RAGHTGRERFLPDAGRLSRPPRRTGRHGGAHGRPRDEREDERRRTAERDLPARRPRRVARRQPGSGDPADHRSLRRAPRRPRLIRDRLSSRRRRRHRATRTTARDGARPRSRCGLPALRAARGSHGRRDRRERAPHGARHLGREARSVRPRCAASLARRPVRAARARRAQPPDPGSARGATAELRRLRPRPQPSRLSVRAQVAIVGGGILGCASAWHLARAGVRDVVVLERGELNAATTSQAAGLIGQLRPSAVKTAIVRQTLMDIAAFSSEGLPTGFHKTGSLRLALTGQRETELLEQVSRGRRLGVDVVLVSAKDVARLAPGVSVPDNRVAAWLPGDGYAEPYTLASAYAAAARALGVRFLTGREVTAIATRGGRATGVVTAAGAVEAETIVVAAGAWTAPLAAAAGAGAPVYPVRHQAWVTAPMPWVSPAFPVIRIPDRWAYLRPEVGGLMFGFFEPTPLGVDPD